LGVYNASSGEHGGPELVDKHDAAAKQGAPSVQIVDDARPERQHGTVYVAG